MLFKFISFISLGLILSLNAPSCSAMQEKSSYSLDKIPIEDCRIIADLFEKASETEPLIENALESCTNVEERVVAFSESYKDLKSLLLQIQETPTTSNVVYLATQEVLHQFGEYRIKCYFPTLMYSQADGLKPEAHQCLIDEAQSLIRSITSLRQRGEELASNFNREQYFYQKKIFQFLKLSASDHMLYKSLEETSRLGHIVRVYKAASPCLQFLGRNLKLDPRDINFLNEGFVLNAYSSLLHVAVEVHEDKRPSDQPKTNLTPMEKGEKYANIAKGIDTLLDYLELLEKPSDQTDSTFNKTLARFFKQYISARVQTLNAKGIASFDDLTWLLCCRAYRISQLAFLEHARSDACEAHLKKEIVDRGEGLLNDAFALYKKNSIGEEAFRVMQEGQLERAKIYFLAQIDYLLGDSEPLHRYFSDLRKRVREEQKVKNRQDRTSAIIASQAQLKAENESKHQERVRQEGKRREKLSAQQAKILQLQRENMPNSSEAPPSFSELSSLASKGPHKQRKKTRRKKTKNLQKKTPDAGPAGGELAVAEAPLSINEVTNLASKGPHNQGKKKGRKKAGSAGSDPASLKKANQEPIRLSENNYRIFRQLVGNLNPGEIKDTKISLDDVKNLLKGLGCRITHHKNGSHGKATAPESFNNAVWTIPPSWGNNPIPPFYRLQLFEFLIDNNKMDIDPEDVVEK